MIAQSFEITAIREFFIAGSVAYMVVVSCLTCDHKVAWEVRSRVRQKLHY